MDTALLQPYTTVRLEIPCLPAGVHSATLHTEEHMQFFPHTCATTFKSQYQMTELSRIGHDATAMKVKHRKRPSVMTDLDSNGR